MPKFTVAVRCRDQAAGSGKYQDEMQMVTTAR